MNKIAEKLAESTAKAESRSRIELICDSVPCIIVTVDLGAVNGMNEQEFAQIFAGLPTAQKTALLRVLKGETDESIAKSLGIKEAGVRKHIERVIQAFGLRNQPSEKRISKRPELFALFAQYQPELLSEKTLEIAEKVDLANLELQIRATTEIRLPEGQLPLDSKFYIPRPPVEENCYQMILQPGALIRIKAPQQMGKTSLMQKILNYAETKGCQKVFLDLGEVENAVLQDLDRFLRWFCDRVSRQLGIKPKLEDYWDNELLSSNSNCSDYFEKYLLSEISSSLVLGLDNVELLFSSMTISQDFFGLLRTWHEYSKTQKTWKKLHLIVTHSTEIYVPLDADRSPFNVGLPVELPEFTREQIEDLAKRYNSKLTFSSEELKEIMDLLGGHPYLIQIALYHISYRQISVEEFLATSLGDRSIYRNHLLNHADNLKKNPKLFEALKAAFKTNKPMNFSEEDRYKLQSLGLIKEINRQFFPRCDLYRQYFSK